MKNKGFVVSAVLYPLLVLFLALIMGLLSMTDTRKRILDKMKLEISDSIFDEATCSCDTIINKLNYIIRHGVGGGGSESEIMLNIKSYETAADIPFNGNKAGDIALITSTPMSYYYVSAKEPSFPKEGMVWVHYSYGSKVTINSDTYSLPVSYVTQYICEEEECHWQIIRAFVYDDDWSKLSYFEETEEVVWNFGYTGNYQEFKAKYTGDYKIELWGASIHSMGAYVSGEIFLQEGTTLYVYVGQMNQNNPTPSITYGYSAWNGGGTQGGSNVSSGGGATDVRTISGVWNSAAGLRSRIIVAAGSGSYGGGNCQPQAGAGGGLSGYNGEQYSSYIPGKGGTQISGGAMSNASNTAGGFGYGGYSGLSYYLNNDYKYPWTGGAGGGGWYGGSGGQGITSGYTCGSGGGGGSSYISGHAGCIGVTSDGVAKVPIYTNISDSYSYTGYVFKNTVMIDGLGYKWTTSKGTKVEMPSPTNNNYQSGHHGNGYAKITLIELH